MTKKLNLIWSEYYKYDSESVEKYSPEESGVYKIGFLQSDDTLEVRYVGQTDNICDRLIQHLDFKNEENECLVEKLKKYIAYFSFAEIVRQEDRDGAERALYLYYEPVCNDPDAIPNGPDIEINYKK